MLQAEAHYARLRRSAAILRLELPYSNDELIRWTLEILRRNDARTDTYIRPLVFVSAEEIGVRLHGMEQSFLIYTAPLGAVHRHRRRHSLHGQHAGGASRTALSPRGPRSAARTSTRRWPSPRRSTTATTRRSCSASDGHVSEGSAENLFMLRDGVFITPPVTEDILEGITRKHGDRAHSRRARPPGRRTQHRSHRAVHLRRAAAVRHRRAGVAGRSKSITAPLATGASDATRRQLQDLYFRAVRGEDPRYRDWLTPVYG